MTLLNRAWEYLKKQRFLFLYLVFNVGLILMIRQGSLPFNILANVLAVAGTFAFLYLTTASFRELIRPHMPTTRQLLMPWLMIEEIWNDAKAISAKWKPQSELPAAPTQPTPEIKKSTLLTRFRWLVDAETRDILDLITEDIHQDALQMREDGQSLQWIRFAVWFRSIKTLVGLTMSWVKATFYRTPSVDKFKT